MSLLATQTDRNITFQFQKTAWKPCPFCGASKRVQYIWMYSELFEDGQVWCAKCESYLGMWDRETQSMVSRAPEKDFLAKKRGRKVSAV